MDRKAQYSRIDLVAWYGLCIIIVVITIGALYSFDLIDGETRGGQITAASITEDIYPEIEETNEEIAESNSTIVTEE